MKKYIDAEKLKAEIERFSATEYGGNTLGDDVANSALDYVLEEIIPSLQQEQEPTCKTCGFYENNCPFIRDKLIPYPNKVCKDYIYSVMKEQEQPEVDLDAIVNEAFDKYSTVDGYGQLAVSFNRAELYSFIKKIARKEK